jgi:hypothetical protein
MFFFACMLKASTLSLIVFVCVCVCVRERERETEEGERGVQERKRSTQYWICKFSFVIVSFLDDSVLLCGYNGSSSCGRSNRSMPSCSSPVKQK